MTTNRDRLIDAATELFYRDGFHGVGLDRILDEVGVTKTTFYNHFESKDALIVAMLEKRDRVETEALFDAVHALAGDDPRARLLAIFDVLTEWFRGADFQGCIFVSAAVAFPTAHDPIHRAAAQHGATLFKAVRALAEAADADDPDALAGETLLLISGAVTGRHVNMDPDGAAVARRIMEGLIERRTPAAATPQR